MARKLRATATPFPRNTPISKPVLKLDATTRQQLGQACRIIFEYVSLGNRAGLEKNLDIWNAILEMRSTPTNVPWEGAAHLVSPTVFSAYQEFCSRTIGSVLQPRPYTMRGNDPVASRYAHATEQFYNQEWDRNDCFDAYEEAILFSARDSTSIMEVLYELSSHQEVYEVREPVFDRSGNPVIDPATQLQQMQTVRKTATFVDYDAPREVPVDLKSFYWYPVQARSINTAGAVGRKLWLGEREIDKLVASKIFDADEAEAALSYVSTGAGEQSFDPQGNSQWTIGNMITVMDTAIAPPAGVPMARGPLEVIRWHTDLFDLDGDGVFEENVIWFHYRSARVLGVVPFDYFGGRPFFELTPIRRPGVFVGWGIPEIGRSIQEEIDTQTNARLNLLDLALKPGRYKTANARYRDPEKRTGPDVEVEVGSPNDVGYLQTPRIPQESFIEAQAQEQRLDRAVGAPQAAAMQPVGGQQQRSARAASIEMQLRAMQSNLVNTRIRRWMLKIFKYKHGLYLRYGKDQLETVQETQAGSQRMLLPKEILGLDYTLGITGLGGALDKENRRQDLLMLVQGIMQLFPQLVQGNFPRQWHLARLLTETFDIADVTSYIGTLEEAVQMQQAQQQAAQGQGQLAALMQVLSHQSREGGRPNGQQAPQQAPQQPSAPGASALAALGGA
ncbi:MAG: hypothetical protein KGL39_08985 [Patescibacteria group bacterium]|nr:hypothetical protein [Patescibacteria group bacterium]